jgi:enoyl-CoA hydratase
VEEAELLPRAREWAARINANGPMAVRATKESVLRGLAVDMNEAYKIEQELSSMVFQSDDAKEGPKAFAEKRPPVWTGR